MRQSSQALISGQDFRDTRHINAVVRQLAKFHLLIRFANLPELEFDEFLFTFGLYAFVSERMH
jgi:hypothetical protein